MKRSKIRLGTALVVLTMLLPWGGPTPGLAQDAQQEGREPADVGATERVRVTLRTLDFLVLDRNGRPITDLRPDEVQIIDDGQRQTILDLIPAHGRLLPAASTPSVAGPEGRGGDAELPHPDQPADDAVRGRWILFLFDANNLSVQGRLRAGRAALQLVEKRIRPEDRVALMVDDDELRILVPFTRRREQLLQYLESPDTLSSRYRDIEMRLRDLRDDAEYCRTVDEIASCAEQATTNFLFETTRETERSLEHLEALLRSLGSIPDRKLVFYVSEGFLANPGDVASAAMQHAVGQFGYHTAKSEMFLMRDYRHRLEPLYQLASRSRVGLYAVNTVRKMTDDLFAVDRPSEGGPENLPHARNDPFEASWQQVRQLHTTMAEATGARAIFRRDPEGYLEPQLDTAAGVYTVTYYPTSGSWKSHRIKIRVERKGARVHHRERYRPSLQPEHQLGGTLVVTQSPQDRGNGLIRADLRVGGGLFRAVPDSKPPASVASLFFELRDEATHPVQEMHEVIAFPRPTTDGAGELKRPFAVKIRPGRYTLRVDIQDVYGAARGSFEEAFVIGPDLELLPRTASSDMASGF